jgi:hypothetical protein
MNATKELMKPVDNARIAMFTGYFNEDHYHTVALASTIAYFLADGSSVFRHKVADVRSGQDAMNKVYARGDWHVEDTEKVAIDRTMELYRRMIASTPIDRLRQCLAQSAEHLV